jgi:hypothetical protein
MSKKPIVVFVAMMMLSALAIVAKADSPTQPSTKFYSSENKKYVFVMLLSDDELELLRSLTDFRRKELQKSNLSELKKKKLDASILSEYLKEKGLREKYKRTGLYLRGDPQKLVWAAEWTFDEYIFGGDIKVANDGIHLVQLNGWIRRNLQRNAPDFGQEVLCFISSGKKIRSYKAGQIVSENEKLEETGSGYFWNQARSILNNGTHTFTIRKVNGDRLIFDVETGNLISGQIPERNI